MIKTNVVKKEYKVVLKPKTGNIQMLVSAESEDAAKLLIDTDKYDIVKIERYHLAEEV